MYDRASKSASILGPVGGSILTSGAGVNPVTSPGFRAARSNNTPHATPGRESVGERMRGEHASPGQGLAEEEEEDDDDLEEIELSFTPQSGLVKK